MAKLKILLTGGTGFLGKYVVPRLREFADVDVISRSSKAELRGDLTRWNGGLDFEKLKTNKYDIFIHLAGLYDLSASHMDCFQQNVVATGTALKIARSLNIPVFVNASSVAAAVNSSLGMIKPYDLNFSRAFPDPYSESKALGEQIIMNQAENFRLCINLRLGVLIGDTQKGSIQRIDGPYHAPQALEKVRKLIESFPTSFPLPGKKMGRLPLVPVDKAAEAIAGFAKWSQDTSAKGYKSFHVTPKEGLPIHDLYLKTLKHLFIPHKGVTFVNRIPKTVLTKISKWTVKFPEEELNYLLTFPKYDSTNTIDVLGNWCPEFEDYEKTFWRGYDEYISNR
ncbi:SDR family oxidoreductase [Bdellovibrio sp. HCB337]|uniref:SDR family oxidoreductase n=1 Tax=Bdellovibrio sp. HCB337 TaxID=3394358 RepID=UPI0039A52B46